MNILIDIAHPAQVHLLRNFYFDMIGRGHNVFVTIKNIPSARQLLHLYGIPYECLGKKFDNIILKGIEQLIYDFKLLRIALKNNIDIGIGSSITIAQVSRICRMKSIILDDDDDGAEPLFVKYAHPFANVILSPTGTARQSKRVIHYPAYHELAYLHPKRFTPDPLVLDDVNIRYERLKDGSIRVLEPYFVLRFNAFKAHHDVGVAGLTFKNKRHLVQMLSKFGKVFITTERHIDDEFFPYQLHISQEKVHSLLYYATMFIGDSQTMASEAAVLGTPAIRCCTLVGKIHYLEEEEHRYHLVYGFLPERVESMFGMIQALLKTPNLSVCMEERRQKLLAEKMDYTAFLVWFVENYPFSVVQAKGLSSDDPFWENFK